MTPEDFIAALLPVAHECRQKYGIPVSFQIADAALETGWGKSVRGNNLYGIKADAAWHGPTVAFATHENEGGKSVPQIATFRAYASWDDSVRDHAQFLRSNPRYAACFRQTTTEGWAHEVEAAHYATDPGYAAKILAVINGRKLTQYDQ